MSFLTGCAPEILNLIWHKIGVDVYLRLSSRNDDAILNVMFGAFDVVADILSTNSERPGPIAQSVAMSLGNQEAPQSILAISTSLREDLVMKIFLRPFFLFR